MVSKLLVANRGEIAVRVMRTASQMGIRTVAVYSDADERALHRLVADEAVYVGPSDPRKSYLDIDRIVGAAKRAGCDAIHPGYGFLSENPAFAGAVAEAGITFVGPTVAAMRQLGSKTVARQLAAKARVPFIPGMTSASDDPAKLLESAAVIGFPVLLKASAGGGGKGMRVVSTPGDLALAAQAASSEALAAFGDGSIYLEKVIKRPRHVEIQILADHHGNVVHLFERECSIQRRHQKIIEETPSTALTEELRARMGQAAVAIAKAADYRNAGTVEFLLDPAGNFYFLEVNTRLQVEHPITEAVTGLDLVRHQIEIARGKPLPFTQQDLERRGHAIECRIYAEDPETDFMPSPGSIVYAATPQGPGVRYDSGIYSGCEVPVHYDPILAKLVVWAEDRPAAIARMIHALRDCAVLGVTTPIELLLDVLASEPFRAGQTFTDFLDAHFPDWHPSADAQEIANLAKAAVDARGPLPAAHVAPCQQAQASASPWHRLGAWDIA